MESMQQWLLLLLAGSAAVVTSMYWSYRRKNSNSQLSLPPGPAGWPIFGNLGIFMSSSSLPHQELDGLAKQYGPLMSLRLGSQHAIVVSSPKVAEEVLKTFDKEFASRPRKVVAEVLGYGKDTLVWSPNNSHWRFLRRVAILELLSPKRLQQFEAVRAEEMSSMIRGMVEASQKDPNSVVDVNQGVGYLMINTITRMLMNKRFFTYVESHGTEAAGYPQEEEMASEFKAIIKEVFFLAGMPFIGELIPYLGFLDRIMNYKGAMQRLHNRFDSFFERVIEEHRQTTHLSQGQTHKDFLDILLSLPGEDAASDRLEDSTIKGILLDLLIGGSLTTSNTIEWGLSELIRAPQELQKVQAEVDSVVGRDRMVQESDVPHLPYLQAVIKEVFRLHPAVPFLIPHENPQPCRLAGFDIPAGTTTLVNVWALGRSPDSWESPLEFLPERFLGKDIDVQGKHFQLLPFGSGRRGCPGANLALVRVGLTLAMLAHSFDWTLPHGHAPHKLDMAEGVGGLVVPRATPLCAIPHPRLPLHLY